MMKFKKNYRPFKPTDVLFMYSIVENNFSFII